MNSPLKAPREDVHATTSSEKGLHGLFETLLRRFRGVSFPLLLGPLTILCCLCLGISAAPGLWLMAKVSDFSQAWSTPLRYVALGCALSTGYLMYGLTLIFVVPLANFLLPFRVRAFRGPWYSLQAVPWYYHNALTYIVRFTFLEFITPTPLNVLFYRMMGMKIGKGVVINTTFISDPSLIEIGDYVTIGGSATIFAHYGQKGYLVIAPTIIGAHTTIGLKASVMGGAKVGAHVNLKPHACVMPRTEVPDHTTL